MRSAAGECLGTLCKHFGTAVYEASQDTVLGLVRDNLERAMDVDSSGGGGGGGEKSQVFHDTAGWRNLETSIKCLEKMVEGCGQDFRPFLDEELLNLIFVCLVHSNRFVRETGFQVGGRGL